MASRLWDKDVSLWLSSPNRSPDKAQSIADRLGWLHSIEWMRPRVGELRAWAGEIAGRYDRAILLGMGGASLAAAVFASLFAPARGGLPLEVLDTTNPDEIARVAGGDLRRCLFIVASKSGSTVETVALYRFLLRTTGRAMRRPAVPLCGDYRCGVRTAGAGKPSGR